MEKALPTITQDTWNAMTEAEKASLVNAHFPERCPPMKAFGSTVYFESIGFSKPKGSRNDHDSH